MPRSHLFSAGTLAALALAGCGSGAKTVSVGGEPATHAATATTATSTAPATTTTPATAPTSTANSTATTRSAPEPAFTEHESKGEGSAANAAAVVRAHGFTPNDSAEYHSSQTLRVLAATRTGSGDGYGQQVFFFVDGRFLGTDTKEPSAKVRVVSQSDTEVTVAYPLYRPGDALCCPGAGQATVHFALNNGHLQALDPVPPANSTSRPSRN